ncbi:MAG: hypothetical protein GC155_09900 [Alphaproteobacteria bacterium]|nr:hypothetical protein [Alphaproteobacteria bacterium]
MSVLQLRRDMVVADPPASDAGTEKTAVVEIDAPFPLRTINVTPEVVEPAEADHEEISGESLMSRARGWLRLAAAVAIVGAYPSMIVMSSGVGDHKLASVVDRAQWTAPWAGAAATLMERHYAHLGWASDAADWTPMARLSAKPALQHAMAESLGEYINLMAQNAVADGHPDADLSAAARLVNVNSTGAQLRAARDALVNYDRRERRRGAIENTDPARLAAQLQLVSSWAERSQTEVARVAAMTGGGPIDQSATQAVYDAKGRAQAAYALIGAMHWPEDAKTVAARNAALAAWKAAAQFHPLFVLNGSPDGSIFGNHAASMGFLIAQAQTATADYLAAIRSDAGAGATDASVAVAKSPADTVR